MSLKEELIRELNRLTKWRAIFAGWQLGTRAEMDGECMAVRDHRELSIILRAEQNALVGLLIQKGVFQECEWSTAVIEEARLAQKEFEGRFPGAKATDIGLDIDPAVFAHTMRRLHFPE
jgi:hypothetical protein